MLKTVAPLNIKDAVLEKYHNILDASFSGELSLSSIPPNYLKPEFRKYVERDEQPLALRGRQSTIDLDRAHLPKAILEKDSAPSSKPKRIGVKEYSKGNHKIAENRSAATSIGVLRFPEALPVSETYEGIAFKGKDAVVTECLFSDELLVLEIYRNPEGKIAADKFTSEEVAKNICRALGQAFYTYAPAYSDFEDMRLIEDLIGGHPERGAFKMIGNGDLMIMPNNTSVFFAIRAPKSVSCILLLRQEEIDGLSYDKLDILYRSTAHIEISSAIKSSISKFME